MIGAPQKIGRLIQSVTVHVGKPKAPTLSGMGETTFRDLVDCGPGVVDGGLATELEARGHDLTGRLWSARMLAEAPDAIRQVHRTYYRAGANIAITASYQASRQGFEQEGIPQGQADRLLRLSIEIAREARELAVADGATHPMFIAASVGPYGAVRHDGSEYRGHYGLSHRELMDFHLERLEVLLECRPDLLAIETVPDLVEAEALVAALDAVQSPVPAWLSFSCGGPTTTNAGQPVAVAAELVQAADRIDLIGVNCTPPHLVAPLLARMRSAAPTLPVVVYPNAGRVWDGDESQWHGTGTDLLPEREVAAWFDRGSALVGGCCGLGPTAVSSIARVAADRRRGQVSPGPAPNRTEGT